MKRRQFLAGTAAASAATLSGCSWAGIKANYTVHIEDVGVDEDTVVVSVDYDHSGTCGSTKGDVLDLLVTLEADGEPVAKQTASWEVGGCKDGDEVFAVVFTDINQTVTADVKLVNVNY